MVTFKNIVEAINDDSIQIEYYRWDDNYHRSMLYLQVFGDEEERKIFEGLR